MDSGDDLTSLAESVNEQIWGLPPDELRAWQGPFLKHLADRGVSLGVVLSELSDESLALMFRAGFVAAEAFTALLVDRYAPYMARWLARWGTEPHQALDLVQQIYVKFFEGGLASFRPQESFRAYLRQAVYHLWVARVVRARKHYGLDRAPPPVSTQLGPEQALLDREATQRIDEALGRLPPREQQVVRETMTGKSADEIARTLGLRKEQVFMSLFRGRRRLEQLLSLPRKSRPARDGAAQTSKHEKEPGHAGARIGT
jgi:RNA polymerase sigma factor (sigma-70 family)